MNCHYTPEQVLSMHKSTVLKLIPAIGAFREMASKQSKDKFPGPVKDHVVSSEDSLKNLDFVETK